MVADVIHDCFVFLLLGFLVLFGFAVAFHVLFRHIAGTADATAPPGMEDNRFAHSSLNGTDDDTETAFGTLHESILTLFCALFGSFEFEVKPQSSLLSSCATSNWLSRSTVQVDQACLG